MNNFFPDAGILQIETQVDEAVIEQTDERELRRYVDKQAAQAFAHELINKQAYLFKREGNKFRFRIVVQTLPDKQHAIDHFIEEKIAVAVAAERKKLLELIEKTQAIPFKAHVTPAFALGCLIRDIQKREQEDERITK